MRTVKASNTPSKDEVVKFKHEGSLHSVTGDGIKSALDLLSASAKKKTTSKKKTTKKGSKK
jgi:hypothetical protein